MELKPGSRWKSAVCSAEVVVVRPPKLPVGLECGGHPMIPMASERPVGLTPAADQCSGVLMGKRYFDAELGLELLASKSGEGALAIDGKALAMKEAKALPSSD